MKHLVWDTATLVVFLMVGLAGVEAGQGGGAANPDEWKIDPARGPVDLGLTDPSLVGAIDIHQHLDPDTPGTGGAVRALDAFEGAIIAKARGMRGVVFKTHQDSSSAGVAYLVRKHVVPGFEMFGRAASNYSTGGINIAALEHFTQIKGGWGRIYEMPTRDSVTGAGNMTPASLALNRPWMLLMPPGTPAYVAVSKAGQLLPEVIQLIAVMAKIRTVDSNGRVALATGHATPEEHLLLAREGRRLGLQVLVTHPGDVPQVPEAAKLGAFIEMTASNIYKTDATSKTAADFVRKVGADHIIVSSDCGQTANLYPTDCLALTARGMRAHGITPHEIDLMFKVNPALLLSLPPLDH